MLQLLDACYRIVEVFGAAKEGDTYLVEDVNNSNNKLYVLKHWRPQSTNTEALNITRSLFTGEAQTLEKLGELHDQIPKILAYTEENQEFFLIQEYIPGNTLREEFLPGQNLGEEKVIKIISEILEILVLVHNRGVIHRDIKPENIIRRETDKKLVLVDFAAVKEAVTNASGTNEYIPMEQFHGNAQFNSDIYALGILAIEALTGLPAKEISGAKSPKNILTGEIIWRRKAPQVSNQFARIINKMVCVDFRKRYQTAQSVLRDLRKLQTPKKQHLKPQIKLRLILMTGATTLLVVGIASWFLNAPGELEKAKPFYENGMVNYEQDNYKGAIDNFTKAIETYPEYAQAYNRRGDSYYRLGYYEKAQQDSSEAIRLNPADANAYFDRGFSLYKLGNYNGAIVDLKKAIELEPTYADAYYGLGLARVKIKEKLTAMGDFSKAIALKPEFAEALIERGILRRQLGQKLESFKDFDEAIAIKPDNAEVYYERAKARFALNEKQKAIADYTKAIELDNKYVAAYIGRGDVYSELSYNDKAFVDYNQALTLNPKAPEAYVGRGNFLFQMKDVQGAIKDYNKALELNPKLASAYNYRAIAELELGKFNKAVDDYSKAIEVNPEYALAYYNRGLLLTTLGRVPQAVEDFQKAANLFKDKGDQNSYNDAISRLKELSPSTFN